MDQFTALQRPAPSPNVTEVMLSGGINSTTLHQFTASLDEALQTGAYALVIQAKDVTHISSAPLAHLVAISDLMKRRGGVIFIAEVSAKVRVIIDTLGLQESFRLFPTVDEARRQARAHAELVAKAPRLVELVGGQPRAEYPLLGEPVRIGSDPKSSIVLKHPQVEPAHAEIASDSGRVRVRDLRSRAGTFVAGKRINEMELAPGQVISIATFQFGVTAPGSPWKPA